MSNKSLTDLPEWSALEKHWQALSNQRISDFFKTDNTRQKQYSLSEGHVTYDLSRNHIDDETIQLLANLARACDLEKWRDRMFAGDILNTTDKRAALHGALRGSVDASVSVNGENVPDTVSHCLEKMRHFVEQIQSDKNITDIVNIGVGGSDIGPKMVCEALSGFKQNVPNVHFLSSVDPAHFVSLSKDLNPKTTLFIFSSKSFGTQETRANARAATQWLKESGQNWAQHFIAVTSKKDTALEHGILEDHIFYMPSWVGGRFSLWSAIGLSIALAIGFDNFEKLLEGAKAADTHFKTQPIEKNIPILLGMIGIWYRNFCHYNSLCILPYNYHLRFLPSYVQQLDMESNGKTVDRDGDSVSIETSPVVFGALGTNAQHAFFQLLHQGSTIIPTEFICAKNTPIDFDGQYDRVISNVLGQTQALMDGQNNPQEPHKHFSGNRPSTTIWLEDITPYNLGILLAFYEHKTFVQGVIWGLNSFDQWGVELGKDISKNILKTISA